MTLRRLVVYFSLVGLLLATAVGARPTSSFKVTSSLDGKQVLPHRQRWLAYPSLASSKVKSVDFAVDGRVRWTEHSPPYVYGGDDAGRNQNYLVTSG